MLLTAVPPSADAKPVIRAFSSGCRESSSKCSWLASYVRGRIAERDDLKSFRRKAMSDPGEVAARPSLT